MNAGKKLTLVTCMLAMTGLMYGCGTDEPPSTTFSGFVEQGPISNAVVFLDLDGDGIKDAGEPSTTTGPTGSYTMVVPPGTVVTAATKLVVAFTAQSQDTVTLANPTGVLVSNPPALPASGGAAATTNITPITTLTALVPAADKAALQTKLTSIGFADPNARINSAPPAVIALVKSVEAVISASQNAISDTNTAAGNTLARAVAASVATEISKPASVLTTPAGIATALSTGAATAISNTSGVFATAPTGAQITAITTALNTAATTVATQVQTQTGGVLTSLTPVSEAVVVAPITAAIETAKTNAENTIDTNVPATVADTQAPTVIAGSTAVTTTSLAPVISVQFSENVQSALVTTGITMSNGITGTVAYDSSTFAATFTPTTLLAAGTTYTLTVSNTIKDIAGNALAQTYTFTITTAAAATGATGGTGGSTGGTGISF